MKHKIYDEIRLFRRVFFSEPCKSLTCIKIEEEKTTKVVRVYRTTKPAYNDEKTGELGNGILTRNRGIFPSFLAPDSSRQI
jgi:hypothetical protein